MYRCKYFYNFDLQETLQYSYIYKHQICPFVTDGCFYKQSNMPEKVKQMHLICRIIDQYLK